MSSLSPSNLSSAGVATVVEQGNKSEIENLTDAFDNADIKGDGKLSKTSLFASVPCRAT